PQLPAHDVGPLVQQERQVAVALHPLREVGVDHRLARGPHDRGLLELLAAGVGDHRELGAEPLDVLLLAFEVALGDEQREVRVGRARVLDAPVELGLHPLPDRVPVGPDDHRSPHRPVVGQLGLGHHVLVPAREVLRLRREDGGLRDRRARLAPTSPRSGSISARDHRRISTQNAQRVRSFLMSSTRCSTALGSSPFCSSRAARSASASAAAPLSALASRASSPSFTNASASATSASTISSSGTTRTTWPLMNRCPRRRPAAMPMSASRASPGPLTTQPITATWIGRLRSSSAACASRATLMTSISARPHDGHAIRSRPLRSRRPIASSSWRPARASSTGSAGGEWRMVSPMPP